MADIDFADLAQQALAPPTSPSLGSNVVPLRPGAPAPDYEGLAGQIMGMQHGVAVQNLVDAQGANPDKAAKALAVSRSTGIPQPAAEENLDQAQQTADLQKNTQALQDNPGLSAFVANNPLAARIAQDDFDKLGLVERLTTALKSGSSTALLTNQLGREGNTKQVATAAGVETPGTDAKIASLQSSINAQPKLTGPLGLVQGFTGFLTGLVDNAIQGGTIGGLSGAAVGAGAGAAAGGVGAIPGAVAGAGIGTVAGFNVDMARVAAGNAYIKMGQMRGADGQPLSEGGKQFGAIFTGAATYALGTYATAVESKLVGETAESLAQAAIAKAVQTPTFARAVTQFAGSTAKGAAQGAVVMSAMEASGIIGEEIAKITSSGDFQTDPHEIIDRLADAAINGAVLLGTMHGAMRGLSLYGDTRSAIRAQGQAEMFKNILTGAENSKLRDRDLQGFQEFMQHQTDGTPVESLYLPADRVRELYQGARFNPEAGGADPIFGFVPDMAKQLSEAGPGGDVVIPTADFVAHLAGTPVAEHLLPDLRVGADSMSLNEAKAFQKEYADRLKTATDEAAKPQPVDSAQKISDEVRKQAVEAGYSDTVASKYAALYAARYSARGARLGVDPYEAFKQSGISIQPGGETKFGGKVLSQDKYADLYGEMQPKFDVPKESHATIKTDEQGRSEIKTSRIRLTESTEVDRFEAILGKGEEMHRFVIRSPEGGVLGHTDLLLKDGKVAALYDIETSAGLRGKGVGAKVVEAITSLDPDRKIDISNIVPEARGFWEKVGVQVNEGNPSSTLDWHQFAESAAARDRGISRRSPEVAGEAKGLDTGAGAGDGRSPPVGDATELTPEEAAKLGFRSFNQSGRDAAVVALRKRASILQSILECLA